MNEVAKSQPIMPSTTVSPFSGEKNFELAVRMAKALDQSDFLPKEFKGKTGNTLVAFELANRLNMPVPLVLQNCHIIHGKPSFSSKTQIGLVNQSGKFDMPLMFKLNEDKTECFAWTKLGGEMVEGPLVTMKMASAEGWVSKNGSKWKTMPVIMLMYRSATFFASLYAPEILMGIPSSEELYDSGPAARQEPASLTEVLHERVDTDKKSGPSLADLAQGKAKKPVDTQTTQTIACPDAGDQHVDISVCDVCSARNGCPSWPADPQEAKRQEGMGDPPPHFG